MLSTTRTAMAAILSADPSVTSEQKQAVLAAAAMPQTTQSTGGISRVVRRSEASRILGLGLKRIDQLARAGVLERVTIPGCRRSIGFSEASLRGITEKGGAA